MFHYEYKTKGACATHISFDLDEEGRVHNVVHKGGCNGNLKTVAKLVEGMPAEEIEEKLLGIHCGMRGTSCSDQLAQGVIAAKRAMENA